MLPKRKRVTAQEVAFILARGRSVSSKSSPAPLSLKYVVKEGSFKAGVIVSKAVARKATLRNAARRAVYRALASAALPEKGFHVLFFVRTVPKEAKTDVFREEIAVLLKKL